MKKMKQILTLALISSVVLFTTSCGNDDDTGTATIQVAMIDAPADYDAVFVDLVDVQINGGEDEEGWVSLDAAAMGTYDLLKLTNGEEAFLGEVELPAGQLSQLRMILGENNELVIDGETIELTTPSAQQSGLKLNVNAEIEAGVTYKLVIDFDAAKSVVKRGNSGAYNLKPVLRAQFEAQTGAIRGVVAPADVAGTVYAIQGTDSASTYPDEASGEFLIGALEAGTYEVVAVPTTESGFENLTTSGVEVVVGEATAIDSLKFE